MKMDRFTPYLGALVALLLGAFVVAFSSSVTVLRSPSVEVATSSSLSVSPGFTLPTLAPPDLESGANIATTAVQATPPPQKSLSSKSVPVEPPPLSSRTLLNSSASALVDALVNIMCYVPAGSSLHSMSGSGVIVDPKGIILTNAHVAQYFLLADHKVSCTIRAGIPATDSYEASLIYISPAWLRANTTVLTETSPSGTGEYDFAFLAITKSAAIEPLPSLFPFIPLAKNPVLPNTPVVIASYGAQFLESNQIQSSLFPTLVYGLVKEVLTFNMNTIDVLVFDGSAVAQEGSSGGGVADKNGELVGTITTSVVEGDISTRSLSAVTASYIRAEYANETGTALDLLLAKPVAASVADFAPQIPVLESILELP